jgi:hypothetical protein
MLIPAASARLAHAGDMTELNCGIDGSKWERVDPRASTDPPCSLTAGQESAMKSVATGSAPHRPRIQRRRRRLRRRSRCPAGVQERRASRAATGVERQPRRVGRVHMDARQRKVPAHGSAENADSVTQSPEGIKGPATSGTGLYSLKASEEGARPSHYSGGHRRRPYGTGQGDVCPRLQAQPRRRRRENNSRLPVRPSSGHDQIADHHDNRAIQRASHATSTVP